jgi:hypothetical protein
LARLYTAAWAALTAVAFGTISAQAPTLTPAQRGALERSETVVVTEARSGSAWPVVSVFVLIDVTPEQAAATFADFEAHAKYIPSITKAKISRVIDSSTLEVDYTLKVPIVSDEDYTVRDHVSQDSNGYRVDWIMVRASSTKNIIGHALFSPHTNTRTGKAVTLLEYVNFVTPGSRLAGIPFIRNRAAAEVRETVEYIAREVNSTKNSPAMTSRVATLRRIVGAPR